MKYVIVSIYDCGVRFDVCDNGEIREGWDEQGKWIEEFKRYIDDWEIFREWLYRIKYKDYDLIIVSEDGETIVLKDTTKGKKCEW